MERQYVRENYKSRERLTKLVNEITDDELQFVIYKEGWTIAVALGHLAFWDERRLMYTRIWKQSGVTDEPGINPDFINDALLPFLLAIPPRKAAELCVSFARAVDDELEKLSPELVTAIKGLGVNYYLDRGFHRNMHLDEIDAFLKAKRSGK